MSISCPCCGGPISPDAHPENLMPLVTCGAQRLMLRELIKLFPDYVSQDRLVDVVYGGRRDGGPVEDAHGNIQTYMHWLRKKISGSNYIISASRGVGYRLERQGGAA